MLCNLWFLACRNISNKLQLSGPGTFVIMMLINMKYIGKWPYYKNECKKLKTNPFKLCQRSPTEKKAAHHCLIVLMQTLYAAFQQ